MSASAIPVSAERFAVAIADLPVGNIYAKAAEIENSVRHLESSNAQLQAYADNGDEDCAAALRENEVVVARLRERIDLLKAEMVRRGLPWPEGGLGQQSATPGEYTQLNEHSASPGGLISAGSHANPSSLRYRSPNEDRVGRTTPPLADQNGTEDEGMHL